MLTYADVYMTYVCVYRTGNAAVTITNLFSASSPGLNWGQAPTPYPILMYPHVSSRMLTYGDVRQGMAIKMKIYTTKDKRRSRGVELGPFFNLTESLRTN